MRTLLDSCAPGSPELSSPRQSLAWQVDAKPSWWTSRPVPPIACWPPPAYFGWPLISPIIVLGETPLHFPWRAGCGTRFPVPSCHRARLPYTPRKGQTLLRPPAKAWKKWTSSTGSLSSTSWRACATWMLFCPFRTCGSNSPPQTWSLLPLLVPLPRAAISRSLASNGLSRPPQLQPAGLDRHQLYGASSLTLLATVWPLPYPPEG